MRLLTIGLMLIQSVISYFLNIFLYIYKFLYLRYIFPLSGKYPLGEFLLRSLTKINTFLVYTSSNSI